MRNNDHKKYSVDITPHASKKNSVNLSITGVLFQWQNYDAFKIFIPSVATPKFANTWSEDLRSFMLQYLKKLAIELVDNKLLLEVTWDENTERTPEPKFYFSETVKAIVNYIYQDAELNLNLKKKPSNQENTTPTENQNMYKSPVNPTLFSNQLSHQQAAIQQTPSI